MTRDIFRQNNNANNNSNSLSNETIKFVYHSPLRMINFLMQFSRNDKFKWFTHNWDRTDNFLIDDYKDQCNDLDEYYYNSESPINKGTYNRVRNFINFENKKYKILDQNKSEIPYKWADIVDWCKKEEKYPANAKMPDGTLFKSSILLFKHTIEFRTDNIDFIFNRQIRKLIKGCLSSSELNIEFSNRFRSIGQDLNVYIDVNQVFAAIRLICEWISINKNRSFNIFVDLEEYENSYELSIFHKDSFLAILPHKLEGKTGDFKKIREHLFSVADFSMIVDYKHKGATIGKTIHCNNSNTKLDLSTNELTPNEIIDMPSKIGGVKYILKFFKYDTSI